jgi:hypothetical protein
MGKTVAVTAEYSTVGLRVKVISVMPIISSLIGHGFTNVVSCRSFLTETVLCYNKEVSYNFNLLTGIVNSFLLLVLLPMLNP